MAKTYHHGDLKKAAIKRTVEIIQQKGEADFTLREVAQSLKVSHTAVYRHFKSKTDLLSHIAEEGFLALNQEFSEALAPLKSPRQRLKALGKAYIEFAEKNQGHYRCMFHQELRCSPNLRPELEAAGAQAFSVLEDTLREGIKQSAFRKMDSTITARSVWSGIHGFASLLIDGQFQSANSKAAVNDAIDSHLSFLEQAVLK